ncbi:MAG: hypothetical protein ACE5IR_09895 [bacterium]
MRTKMNSLTCIWILIVAAGLQAQVPHIINYQGIVNDPMTGAPIDTVQTMTFAIYTASNPVVAIWMETQNGVLIQNGYFSVMLGSVIPIPPDVFEGDEKYLGVKIGSDPEMTPRKRIFSVGYAFKAENTDKVAGQHLNNNDGSVNESSDPVSWFKIKDIPAGFADGSDDGGGAAGISQINVGTGLNVTSPTGPTTTLGLKMGHGNSIDADLVDGKHAGDFASSSHNHMGEHWSGSYAWADAILKVTNLSSGPGVYGINTGGGNGVRGQTNGTGIGVYGQCDNSGPGVVGRSASGDGVQGFGQDSGVYGEATGSAGQGVFGKGVGANAEGVVGVGGSNGVGVSGMSSNQPGVVGSSTNNDGVRGISTNFSGVRGNSTNGNGVEGQTNASSGSGVYGNSTNGHGVTGQSSTQNGVQGSTSGGGTAYGVKGTSSGSNSTGVLGEANNGSAAYGIWGKSTSGWAGYFSGNVNVTGTLSKGGGSFKIDHPLDPANKYLYHSFVESPDMMNIYNGNVTLDANGEAVVTMPEWFDALNKDSRYQLTAIGAPGPNLYIAEEISGNHFRIAGGAPGMKVSWQVTGIRNDAFANAHRIPVEQVKSGPELGRYLYPKEHGMPEVLAVDYEKSRPVEVEKK